ncbi:hypothetical protein V7S43_005529 [Phytophthora oleae]|uniref:Uncharacterized protein n=1 Tax=Phytophthora oleae TaxID=2107226 RepID=A0ABD3FTT1_9STRA
MYLKTDTPMKRFTFNKSEEFCFFDHNELSSAMLEKTGPYHIPRAVNFESVDSFYCARRPKFMVKRKLLLFQMTVSSTYPVLGEGIVALLKAVEWLDRAVKDPAARVALIFVFPGDSEKVIDHEQLTPAADGESVTVIPGIGDEMATALGEVEVHTLGDFRSKLPELKRGRKGLLKQCVENFETYEKTEAMLKQIPQYVWKV